MKKEHVEVILLKSEGLKPTFSPETYQLFATRLYRSMYGLGTDTRTIFSVFSCLQNDLDFHLLNEAFGIWYHDFSTTGYSMRGWLIGDLSNSEIMSINNILKQKGITERIQLKKPKMKNYTFPRAITAAVFIYVILQLLFSCTPQRRLERFQNRHPYLFNKANDTILIQDTVNVMIPGTEVDTIISMQDLIRDTVFFQKDGLSVEAYVINDTLYLSAKTDTIFKQVTRELKVPYEKYIYRRPRDGLSWGYLSIIAGLVVCIWLVGKYKDRTA